MARHPASPTSSPAASTPRGRPRSEQARRAILRASIALVERGGYPALTIEAVAQDAGVARTTIYRSWANRALLGIDVLVEMATVAAPPPSGSDPLRALRLELKRVATAASGTPGALLVALLGEAQFDSQVRDTLHQRITHPRRDAGIRTVRAAQDRGQLSDDVSANLIVDLLYGPVFYRLLMGHDAPTERFAEQVFERMLASVNAPRK